MKQVFVYDLHMDRARVGSVFKDCKVYKKAKLFGAKLRFLGDYTFGYPIIEKSNNMKDFVIGIYAEISDNGYEEYERVFKTSRSFKMVKYKATVTLKETEKNAIVFTFRSNNKNELRPEPPLKECYNKLADVYASLGFKKELLEQALLDSLSDYYKGIELMKK